MKVNILRLGKKSYEDTLLIQKKLFEMRCEGKINDTLIFVEHFPVLTLGSRGKYENIVIDKKTLGNLGVPVLKTNRGGDVTYHGDGQIVGYFIFDIRNHVKGIKDFVNMIEEVIIQYLVDECGINSERGEKKYTGIWIGDKKIAAFGIFVSHWITMHGFSFNVNPDMTHFAWINPCGITDKGVTSLEMELNKKLDINETINGLLEKFKQVFHVETNSCTLEEIVECKNAQT